MSLLRLPGRVMQYNPPKVSWVSLDALFYESSSPDLMEPNTMQRKHLNIEAQCILFYFNNIPKQLYVSPLTFEVTEY